MHCDIFRNIHQHRPGTPGLGQIEGFLERHRQVAHILDQKVVFDARAGNADRIALLKSILTNVMGWYLTGEDHQGNRVHVGRGDASNSIGDAGAGGDHTNTNLVG